MALSVARLLRQPLAQALPWLQGAARGFAAHPEKAQDLPQMPPFDHKPAPYKGPSKQEVRARVRQAGQRARMCVSTWRAALTRALRRAPIAARGPIRRKLQMRRSASAAHGCQQMSSQRCLRASAKPRAEQLCQDP